MVSFSAHFLNVCDTRGDLLFVHLFGGWGADEYCGIWNDVFFGTVSSDRTLADTISNVTISALLCLFGRTGQRNKIWLHKTLFQMFFQTYSHLIIVGKPPPLC
jgi:hypothetical protein